MVVFGQKCFLSGKSGSIRDKVVKFGQKWLNSGNSGCIHESGCIWVKFVVFG